MQVIDRKWSRVELVPMDGRCDDITVALYVAEESAGPVGLVHTYSANPRAPQRVRFLVEAMCTLGALTADDDRPGVLRFPCGDWHALAARRLFLEAAKLDPAQAVTPHALEIVDRRTSQAVRVEPLGHGRYAVHAEGATAEIPSRAPAITAALAKLAELSVADDETVAFPCAHDHTALLGLMLTRAQDLRAVIRDEEAKASRGVLVAPSAQE